MGKKRVHTFSTWTDAELAYEASSKIAGVLGIALRELVNGTVEWLPGEQPRKIGLCKLKDPHGGVVVLVEREMVGAMYLNEWLDQVQTQPAPNAKTYMPQYKAWLDIRRLAAEAKTKQEQAHQAAVEEGKGCSRTVMPPVVDQDVRTY